MKSDEKKMLGIIVDIKRKLDGIYENINPDKFAKILGSGMSMIAIEFADNLGGSKENKIAYVSRVIMYAIEFIEHATGVRIVIIPEDIIKKEQKIPPLNGLN